MELYDTMLETYISSLLEKKVIRLGGSNISVDGNPSPNDVRKIMSTYKSGVQFAVKKLYPVYKRSWEGKASQQQFTKSMKPTDIGFRKDGGWEMYFNTDMFEGHSIIVRFNPGGKPTEATI